jgi:predicted transcriptional regulator
MKTIKQIANETGVSVQTVRNYYHKLPDECKTKLGKSFAIDEKGEMLLLQHVQSVPQNQNKSFAKVLQSDSSEVLAYFERVINEKDNVIMELSRTVGELQARLELPPPEPEEIKLTFAERLKGVVKR